MEDSSLLVFGGLSGSDANPVRLEDVQRLDLSGGAVRNKSKDKASWFLFGLLAVAGGLYLSRRR